MSTLFIKNATIINEGNQFVGSVLIKDDQIFKIYTDGSTPTADQTIDATNKWLLPGVIDDHVHFREPGLTQKGDMDSESKAALAGGITSVMEMPNTKPLVTTSELLEAKYALAATKMRTNYSFYFGVTNNNTDQIQHLNPTQICGIKLFMGASTGNMLVDKRASLEQLFAEANMIIATHCESEAIIQQNRLKYSELGDLSIQNHPLIRSEEACYQSTALAVELAQKSGAKLHILHLSTAKELTLLEKKPLAQKQITAEACIAHLWFDDSDYKQLGSKIKCNPAIKKKSDKQALREAINSGIIDLIATDHAPHLLTDKEGNCLQAASGMPTIQYSLVSMIELHKQGVFTIEQVVEKMCHAPATLFQISKRGYIREGYFADLTIVDPNKSVLVTDSEVHNKCGWSPFTGETFHSVVEKTFVNGHLVYDQGQFNDSIKGERLIFER